MTGQFTVLVVEDDPAVLRFVQAILTSRDCAHRPAYKVLTAATAEAGLSLAKRNQIDLLLSDILLPGMRGDELARQLRKTRPEMRVLLMSGNPNERWAVLQNGWQLLEKPFQTAALLDRVSAELAQRAAGG